MHLVSHRRQVSQSYSKRPLKQRKLPPHEHNCSARGDPEEWGIRRTQRNGVTVSALLLVTLSEVPEILTVVVVVTLQVVIVNVADVCAPVMVTVAARWPLTCSSSAVLPGFRN